jgi:hypothetical protein
MTSEIRLGEEFAEADATRRRITSIKVTWTFFKFIVLKRSTLSKMAAKLSDAFALTHKLDFGKAEFLPLCQISGRFVG